MAFSNVFPLIRLQMVGKKGVMVKGVKSGSGRMEVKQRAWKVEENGAIESRNTWVSDTWYKWVVQLLLCKRQPSFIVLSFEKMWLWTRFKKRGLPWCSHAAPLIFGWTRWLIDANKWSERRRRWAMTNVPARGYYGAQAMLVGGA